MELVDHFTDLEGEVYNYLLEEGRAEMLAGQFIDQ
jgi:hypothetical protein